LETTRQSALRRVVLITDGALVGASMLVAHQAHGLLRDQFGVLKQLPPDSTYMAVALSALPIWLLLTAYLGLHRMMDRSWTGAELVGRLVALHVMGLVALSLVLYLTQAVVNRSLVALFLVSSFVLLLLQRVIVLRWLSSLRARGHGRARLLIVGDPGAAMVAFIEAAQQASLPPIVVGRLDAGALADGYSLPPPEQALDQVAVDSLPDEIGSVEDLATILHDQPVDEVLFFPPTHEPRRARSALQVCATHGVPASFAVDLSNMHEAAPRVVQQLSHSFITFEVAPRPAFHLAIKHTCDVFVALVGLVLSAPLLLLASVAIGLTMGRPILFVQQRAGLRGRTFRMLKFRTMVVDAEAQKAALVDQNEMAGPTFKLRDDPRVTRLGRLLRRSSVDELPQLINVVMGAMSLVGPRPLPVDEQRSLIGWHRRRLSMKPGITCLWQVRGRSDVTFDDWMKLDLQYIDSWSFGLDLRILLQTVPAVLRGRGAR